MEQIKRLTLNNFNWPNNTLQEKTEWVSYEDYETMKKEMAILAEIVRRECDGGVDLREEAQRTVEENHQLRAAVNRLIEAGSAVSKELEDTSKRWCGVVHTTNINAWNNAKEISFDGWRPINTANTKSGEILWLYQDMRPTGGQYVFRGSWDENRKGWVCWEGGSAPWNVNPTHWQNYFKPNPPTLRNSVEL